VCKNCSTDQDAIWVENSGGAREPCIRLGSKSPIGRGNFEGRKGHPIVKYRGYSAVTHAKTAEPIVMPFQLIAWNYPKNCELGEVQIPHDKGQFWGKGSLIVKYRDFLPLAVQKWLN